MHVVRGSLRHGSAHRPARLSIAPQDADETTDAEGGASREARLSYSRLYDALARGLANDRSVLLLYALLYGCQPFQVLATFSGQQPCICTSGVGVLRRHCQDLAEAKAR